jgi:hypothetical protein
LLFTDLCLKDDMEGGLDVGYAARKARFGLPVVYTTGRKVRLQAFLHFLGVVARIALGGGGSLGRLDQGILELQPLALAPGSRQARTDSPESLRARTQEIHPSSGTLCRPVSRCRGPADAETAIRSACSLGQKADQVLQAAADSIDRQRRALKDATSSL